MITAFRSLRRFQAAALFAAMSLLLAIAVNAAPPPAGWPSDDDSRWATEEYEVTWGGSKSFEACGLSAWITDGNGSPKSQGSTLELKNASKHTIYYGLSGVINQSLVPGQTDNVPLSIYRSKQDTTPTRVKLYVRFWKGSPSQLANPLDANTGTPGSESSNGQTVDGAILRCEVDKPHLLTAGCACPFGTNAELDSDDYRVATCRCRNGLRWDSERAACTPCAKGSTWDPVKKRCTAICNSPRTVDANGRCSCPSGQTWYRQERACFGECSAGSVRNPSTKICECPGNAVATPQGCTPCTRGSVPNLKRTACECPANTVSSPRGCLRCPEGATPNTARNGCVCPSGKWLAGRACMACPGNSTPTPAGDSCLCPKGHVWAKDEKSCLACTGGSVPNLTADACVCPAQTVRVGATCQPCSNGRIPDASGQNCVCPNGSQWNGTTCAQQGLQPIASCDDFLYRQSGQRRSPGNSAQNSCDNIHGAGQTVCQTYNAGLSRQSSNRNAVIEKVRSIRGYRSCHLTPWSDTNISDHYWACCVQP